MRPHLITMAQSSPSPSRKTSSNTNCLLPNSPNCHSPAATLDVIIFILVLFSGIFLVASYFSYIFRSLSLLLPTLSISSLAYSALSSLPDSTLVFYASFFLFFVAIVIASEIRCWSRSTRCGKPGCKGLKKATKFDLKLQGEDCLRSAAREVDEVDRLPWKGGSETNPHYECLRMELRKMAPPNGRAVLLFREKCGCPLEKLEGWGTKRGRRHKRNGGGGGRDHR